MFVPILGFIVFILDVLIELYSRSGGFSRRRLVFGYDKVLLGIPCGVKLVRIRGYVRYPIIVVRVATRSTCRLNTSHSVIIRVTAAVAPRVFDAQPVHVVASDIVVHLLLHGFLALDALRDHLIVLLHGHRLSHLFNI